MGYKDMYGHGLSFLLIWIAKLNKDGFPKYHWVSGRAGMVCLYLSLEDSGGLSLLIWVKRGHWWFICTYLGQKEDRGGLSLFILVKKWTCGLSLVILVKKWTRMAYHYLSWSKRGRGWFISTYLDKKDDRDGLSLILWVKRSTGMVYLYLS